MRHYSRRILLILTLTVMPAILARLVVGAEHGVSVVGLGRDGETILEFIGRIDQNGANFTFIGYLTRVRALNEASLFASGDPTARTEKTAHFTIKGETTLTSRSTLNNVFTVDSKGKLDIFFNETPSADFTNPGSFSAGDLIASFSISFQNAINAIAPAQGVSTGWGVLAQTRAGQFRLDGRRLQFGRKDQRERVSATGQGTLLDPAIPISVIFITGNMVGLD